MKRKYIEMDYHLARACATDEANRNMRKNGRKAWNEEDYNICVEAFNRLWPTSEEMKRYLNQ